MKSIPFNCIKYIKFKNGELKQLDEKEEIIFASDYLTICLIDETVLVYPIQNIYSIAYVTKKQDN